MKLVARPRNGVQVADWTSYLIRQRDITFTHTGCTVLDCALGSGWAGGRIINVVGDKSTGKTLLAIEATANFARRHPKGLIKYKEAESAFDHEYAAIMGLPLDRVKFDEEFDTVEELFADVSAFTALCAKKKQPGLYVCDSLDALTDKAEAKRDMEEGSYGAKKAALLSQFFRRLKTRMKLANVTLFIISQTRDNIGVTFGRKWTRSGGKALDFYASQIVYLAEVEKLRKTIRGMTRVIGVKIKAHVQKNKVGLPFREAVFTIKFGYGIDDVGASAEYLKQAKVRYSATFAPSKLSDLVRSTWHDVEKSFLPKARKYADL
jgi:recombination protein RecA